ncbi:MAG: Holliday junction resolvase RuvX [Gammaproteobacteria bacterium]
MEGSRRPVGYRPGDAEHGCWPCLNAPSEIRGIDIGTIKDNRNAALAFDYGVKRIGVAFANRTTGTSTPLKTLANRGTEKVDRELRALFSEWEPDTIVIGVPYNMDGSESSMTATAIGFANRLGKMFALPVDRVDERLTSSEAETLLRERRQAGQRRKRVRREDIDVLAAQLIAESWLRHQ